MLPYLVRRFKVMRLKNLSQDYVSVGHDFLAAPVVVILEYSKQLKKPGFKKFLNEVLTEYGISTD